jgi:hypothetical protein
MRPNMLGTRFDVFDCGMDPNLLKQLPKDFYPHQKLLQTVEYDSNFFAEKPRSFRTQFYNAQG